MKIQVYYYSNKGSNRYLAQRIASDLNTGIEEIKPRLNSHLLMLMGANLGNRKLKSKVEDYDLIVLCGPVWMGKFIVPLKNFVQANLSKINRFVFVSCCGSTFDKKDEKYGHNLVFKEVKNLSGEKCVHCEAFPISMVLPPELRDDPNTFMKTHLNADNFKGDIAQIYDHFIRKMKSDTGLNS